MLKCLPDLPTDATQLQACISMAEKENTRNSAEQAGDPDGKKGGKKASIIRNPWHQTHAIYSYLYVYTYIDHSHKLAIDQSIWHHGTIVIAP